MESVDLIAGELMAFALVAIVLLTLGLALMAGWLVRGLFRLYYLLSGCISSTVSQSLDRVSQVTARR